MSKPSDQNNVLHLPIRKSLPPRHPEDDCSHNNSAPGKGHLTLGALRYEFDTDVCQDCGAFTTTSAQYAAYEAWVLSQPPECFVVRDIRLDASAIATARRLGNKFKAIPPDVFRACLLLLDSCLLPDEAWDWNAAASPKTVVLPFIKLHPLLYLRLDAWTHLADSTLSELVARTVNAGLRQYEKDSRFARAIETYLMTAIYSLPLPR